MRSAFPRTTCNTDVSRLTWTTSIRPTGSLRLDVAFGFALVCIAGTKTARAVSEDPSHRYYQDGNGKPVFLIGYYGWAAVPDGYFIDHPSRYAVMIQNGAPYKINYIRISLGVNRMTATSNPPVWPGGFGPTPVPFAYNGSNKADLNTWDSTFWNGLKAQCTLAQNNGVIVHVSFFDGVELRGQGGASYGYNNSFWNPSNQAASFYPAGDYSDTPGGFYRLSNFNSDTGIGHYQRLLIAKAISELAGYNNVMFEIGNELLGSDVTWNTAVTNYIKSLTSKPVTQVGGGVVSGIDGYDDHVGDTSSQVKNFVASFVGHGYPAWIDPDGPGLSDADISPDELRRAAWYSFAGGAAMWGGFTVDYWSFGHGFNTTTVTYYKNLQSFIQDGAVQFWNMLPTHNLVSNGGTTNSCLSRTGEYVVYVRSDSSVTLDLTGLSGTKSYRLYDPRTNTWTDSQNVTGGAVRTFNKPAGTDDWVIYIGVGPPPTCPGQNQGSQGSQVTLGNGIMPSIATDTQGNVHAIFLAGGNVQYKKYDASLNLLTTETINAPSGVYWPHIMCDASNAPHVIFTESVNPDLPYADRCYYTNRIGGSWKPLVIAFTAGSGNAIWYPRIALWGSFAYIGFEYGLGASQIGEIVRLTNLSGTPTVNASVNTTIRSTIAVNGLGQIFAPGRNGPSGTFCQQYDSNLNTVGSLQRVDNGTLGKSGSSTSAWADNNNVVHILSWAIEGGGGGVCADRCGMTYNNTGRRNGDGSYPNCIQGLLGGPAGTGPDGTEPTGWWNDDVYGVGAVDATGAVYVAWRGWTPAGEGRITTVNNTQFTQVCTPESTCNSQICTGTQFTPSITRRRWWNCEMAPALSGGVYVAWDSGGIAYFKGVGIPSSSEASIDMGCPDATNGLTNVLVGDGNTTCATIGGRDCRRNTTGASGGIDHYFYFNVNDFFALNGSKPNLYIYLDYYDTGTGIISLDYDSIGPADIPHEYASGGAVNLTNTNTWKSTSFHLTNAYFGNRENNGADFRFARFDNTTPTFYLDKVTVTQQPPIPPVIASPPSPQYAYAGIPYTFQPILVQGYPSPIWSLCQGPAGTMVGATCGLVSGWTPPAGVLGCQTFCVQASNAAGSDSKSWSVCVFSKMDFDHDGDVDMTDFAHMQICFSGDTFDYGTGCSDADLSIDGDVDAADFNIFLPCMAGADHTPGC